MLETDKIFHSDCREILPRLSDESVDLVYFDPPFFSQKRHKLTSRESNKEYSFEDIYSSLSEYLNEISEVVTQVKRVLKNTGSIFVHCDKYASHHIRLILDNIFGIEQFRSEIIWHYKRWSNAKKGLLNAHQNIFFYSKTKEYKFNVLYGSYSPTTNIDQILQKRERNINGKTQYLTDENGNIEYSEKKGVPLSDIWEIPFLNPKAKERTGYPTQKPIALLDRVIQIASNEGDIILDPYCGSGTTCVSAKLLNRKYIGIDRNENATDLTKQRLLSPVVSDSGLLQKGYDSYRNKDDIVRSIVKSIEEAYIVERNTGIDAMINGDTPIPIKVQTNTESLQESIDKIQKACKGKKFSKKIVVQTTTYNSNQLFENPSDIIIVPSLNLQIRESLEDTFAIK